MARSGTVLLALAALLLASAPAAADSADCSGLSFSLAREKAWFEAGPRAAASGDRLAPAGEAVELKLQPASEVAYVAPPEKAPKDGTFGGLLTFSPGTGGLYQVTLSGEAWIDVVEPPAGRLASVDHTGSKGCPGLRKSVRFKLGGGPVTLQLSGSSTPTIRVAVAPAS